MTAGTGAESVGGARGQKASCILCRKQIATDGFHGAAHRLPCLPMFRGVGSATPSDRAESSSELLNLG